MYHPWAAILNETLSRKADPGKYRAEPWGGSQTVHAARSDEIRDVPLMRSASRLNVVHGSVRVAECGMDQREGGERKMSACRRLLDAREQPGSSVPLSCHGVNPGGGAHDDRLGLGAKHPGKTEVLQGRGVLAKNCEGPGCHGVQVPAMRVHLKALLTRRYRAGEVARQVERFRQEQPDMRQQGACPTRLMQLVQSSVEVTQSGKVKALPQPPGKSGDVVRRQFQALFEFVRGYPPLQIPYTM